MTMSGYKARSSILASLAVAAVVLAAGCGVSTHRSALPPTPTTPTSTTPTSTTRSHCPSAAHTQRALARAQRDLAAIRRAAAPLHHQSLMGTPQLQQATSDFIDHLDAANLGLMTKNHVLSLGVNAVAGTCDQCFQWLEADRPMVALQYGPSSQCTR